MPPKRFLLIALLGGALLAAGPLSAKTTDTTQALLDLLIAKGLVTPQEAAALKGQIQDTAKPAAPPTRPPDVIPASGNPAAGASPLSFRIGMANFTPLGFLDLTAVYRNALNGGDIGSSFGSIPYSNTANSALSETRLSTKNSRLGLRIDSQAGDTKLLGYVETDFLGNAATNVNVASNSDVLRMRVFFLDLKEGPWEFLAGQDWSLLTPNRQGLSPLPSDIFFTQNVDTNYQVGLVWGRTPQVRAIYHASGNLTMGLSAENPDQYTGSAVNFPTGFNSAEVDTGSSGTATPNVLPDFIGKIAFDAKLGGTKPFHAEIAGLYRYFKVDTFTSTVNAAAATSGYGCALNLSLEVRPHVLLVENAFLSKGGGRYLSTGLGPDLIVTPANASGTDGLSAVDADAGIAGIEWDARPTNKIFGYFGVVHFGRDYVTQGGGTSVGYGYPGSPTTDNRQIEELTIGDAQILWKSAGYGDLKLLSQYSYVQRTPWFVAPGSPVNAYLGMLYLDLRYDLP